MGLDADVRWRWFRRTCTRRPRRRRVAKIKVLTGATADFASFTDVTPFTPPRISPPSRKDVPDRLAMLCIGSRHVRPGLPRRLRNTGGGGPSLKGLSTIAWGWHDSAYPRLPIPPKTQLRRSWLHGAWVAGCWHHRRSIVRTRGNTCTSSRRGDRRCHVVRAIPLQR